MFNFRYLFILLLFLLFSSSSFAEEFWWTGEGSIRYSSPEAGCYSMISQTNRKLNRISDVQFQCFGYSASDTEQKYANQLSYSNRRGDTCPPDTSYNPSKGVCESPCMDKEPQKFEFLYCYDYDGSGGCSAGTATTRPSSFCSGSCSFTADYNPATTDADCFSYKNGEGNPSGPAVMCSVTSTAGGGSCSSADEYTPETPNNSCPEGTSSGEFNGKNVCVPSAGGGETGGGDGTGDGGDTGGGDGTGDGGDTGGGDGTGDGDGTGGTGNNGGTGGTGGTGTGEGEGEGEGEGNGTGEGVENCTDGRCGFGDERGDPFGGEVRSYSESMDAFYNGLKSSPISSAINNIKFPSGGVCPTGSTTIHFGFGSFPIEFSEHCVFWENVAPILSAVFLALWAIIAVRVFLSA